MNSIDFILSSATNKWDIIESVIIFNWSHNLDFFNSTSVIPWKKTNV